jgi:uncharacterized membrane protein YfcA
MANEINIGINTTSDLSGLNQVDESVKSLKTQLREAQANVAALSEKFGATSKEAVEAAKSAAELKDKIGDAKSLTDAFNPDAKFKAVSASLAGVAGGFSAVQGAMGLFGEESKDVEKAILKVQSAMALASGIQAIGESIDSFKQMKAVAVNAFNAIKGAIGATGIGLLVVALGTIYAYWDDIKEAVSGVSSEQKKLNDASKKNVDLQNDKLKSILSQDNVLKLQGKSEKEILNLKVKQTDQAIQATKVNIKNQEITNKLSIEGAKRNYEMLKSYLDFISMPLKFLYENAAKGINKIIDLVNGIPGVEIKVKVDEKMVDKSAEWLAKLAFDPEQTKKDGEKVIKESQEALAKLENDRAGYILTQRENDRKASDEAAQKRKEKQKEEDEKAKERAQKSSELLAQQLKEQEDLLANSEVKKENLRNERAKKEIEQTTILKDRKAALDNEEANHVRLLEEAKTKDKEAAYAKEIEIQNSRDIGFEEDLQKQLEHYEEIFAIQVKFGKSTIETQIQIDKTKEALRKENYNKELELLTAQYTNLENDLVKQQEFNEKKLALQKLYGEKTLETENAIVDGKAKINKQEIDQKAATIDAVGKMVVAGAEIGNFIADSLKANAGKDKQRQKTAVRVGAASSIAGVIGSTASANAGFLANPASISTMGLAAAVPIATNIASSLVAVANIIQQKNKAIAEIDNASDSSGGGGQQTPSKFATGGMVTGMGTSTSDSIMARLSNGESVINAKSTAMFGNLLSNINQAGGGVAFGNQNNSNPIFKTYVVASEMTSQIEANLKLKQIARL